MKPSFSISDALSAPFAMARRRPPDGAPVANSEDAASADTLQPL